MRNLASGNKINFTVFTFVVILILVILVCAVVIVLGYEKEEYQVKQSAFIYDNKYNYIELENPAVISKKWTGNYYLKEDISDKEYKLGDYAISHDVNSTALDLFGTFFQVLNGANVDKITGYNTINQSTEDKFYKIDDRKYLIVARDIQNNTGSLSTNNYLIIIIDKLGNALLLNNTTNVKTINEMIITTNDFSFDVANEILTYGEEKIDLKKIIGSTNEYVQTEEENVENTNAEETNMVVADGNTTTITNNNSSSTTTNSSTSTITSTVTGNTGSINAGNIEQNNTAGENTEGNLGGNTNNDYSWVDSLNDWIGNVADAFENIYNNNKNDGKDDESTLNKSIALNSIQAGTTYIDINYTINDPENKYNVVYATVTDGTQSYNISLDKSASTYRLTELMPNTNYTISIGHKIIYADATSKDTIEDSMTTKTLNPSENINVTKVSLENIYYTLKLDSSFVYDAGAEIKIYVDGEEESGLGKTLTASDLETAASKGYSQNFKIPAKYLSTPGTSITIKLEDTKHNGQNIDTNISTTIINY